MKELAFLSGKKKAIAFHFQRELLIFHCVVQDDLKEVASVLWAFNTSAAVML